jgi:hypothetical protein
MRILPTIKEHYPVALIAKVFEKRRSFYDRLYEAYESPSFVLVEYSNGVKIPAPLCLSFKEMLKYSRKVNFSTLSSWVALHLADKGRSQKMVQRYIKAHAMWKECHAEN